jgi:Flp pilus assembly protein TadG
MLRSKHRRGGAVAVEAAVILFPLLIFLFGMIEYCRYQFHRHMVQNAAREGARRAVVAARSATTEDIEAAIHLLFAATHPPEGLTVRVYRSDAQGMELGNWRTAQEGATVAVRVDGSFRTVIPLFGMFPSTIPITACAVMQNEVRP